MSSLTDTNSKLSNSRGLLLLVYLGFILTGIATTLLGPLLPTLAVQWGLNDAQSGAFFLAEFLGSLISVIVCGRLLRVRGFRFCFVVGFALIAIGLATLGRGTWIVGLLSVFIYGCGLGFSVGSTNLWVGESNPSRRAGALSLVNFSWTVGALAAPPIVSLADRTQHTWPIVLVLAAVAFLLTLAFSVSKFEADLAIGRSDSVPEPAPSILKVFSNQTALMFAAIFFLYVGTENSVSGWVATYARRIQTSQNDLWALTPSFFWAGLLLGRLLLPIILRRVPDLKLLRTSLILAVTGCVLLLCAEKLAVVAAACALCGTGLAGVFPIAMAYLSSHCGTENRDIAGVVLASGGLGGGVMPWFIGVASNSLGSLRAGLIIPLAGTISLLLITVFRSSLFSAYNGPAHNLRTEPEA
ncbi:MAG TPA: MFS transporter [Candidatus Acidoferrales bacterium]|nr:MFS transporter [Candidatus Acidoferrales bacterium]